MIDSLEIRMVKNKHYGGDEVICISMNTEDLTYGEKYVIGTILIKDSVETHYGVRNNKGELVEYLIEKFGTLQEFRRIQLEELGI